MPADATLLLAILFLVVGALYASVGHAGASGYLAVMALMGVAPESMRSTALAVNVVVATFRLVVAAFRRRHSSRPRRRPRPPCRRRRRHP